MSDTYSAETRAAAAELLRKYRATLPTAVVRMKPAWPGVVPPEEWVCDIPDPRGPALKANTAAVNAACKALRKEVIEWKTK